MDGNFQNDPAQNQTGQNNYYQDNTTAPYTQAPPASDQPEGNPNNALAVVGLVMGILSIVFACCYGIGVIFGIAGIICSVLARKKGHSGTCTAGLVCSIIGTVLSVIMIIYVAVVGVAVLSDPDFLDTLENF